MWSTASHASGGAAIHATARPSVGVPPATSYVAYSPGPSARRTFAPPPSASTAERTSGCCCPSVTFTAVPPGPGTKTPLNRSADQLHCCAGSPTASQLTAPVHATVSLLTFTSANAHSFSHDGGEHSFAGISAASGAG